MIEKISSSLKSELKDVVMIQFDCDLRSKTIDIHFCLFHGLLNYQYIFKAIATHETHFQLSQYYLILKLFL